MCATALLPPLGCCQQKLQWHEVSILKLFIYFRPAMFRGQGEQVRTTTTEERSAPPAGSLSRSERSYESARLLGDVQTEQRNE